MLNHLLLLTCCKYNRFESYLFNLKGKIYDELFITFLFCTLSFMFFIHQMLCHYHDYSNDLFIHPHPLLGANTEKKTYLEQNKG